MRAARWAAMVFLVVVFAASMAANYLAPAPYARQFRDAPDAAPTGQHWLGTDDLGRDRFSRLLYGTRISLVMAPAAALVACALAGVLGGVAGFAGGWLETAIMAATDLFLSMPWLFLLIAVRACLPLNVSPLTSVAITFLLLGCLGWATGARVVCADARALRKAEFVLLARAQGCGGWQLWRRHLAPNLMPVLLAQFWISVPVFILAEANLGILGLGVCEPLPSWGSLLRELEGFSLYAAQPWLLAPLVLLLLTVSSFQLALEKQEVEG